MPKSSPNSPPRSSPLSSLRHVVLSFLVKVFFWLAKRFPRGLLDSTRYPARMCQPSSLLQGPTNYDFWGVPQGEPAYHAGRKIQLNNVSFCFQVSLQYYFLPDDHRKKRGMSLSQSRPLPTPFPHSGINKGGSKAKLTTLEMTVTESNK